MMMMMNGDDDASEDSVRDILLTAHWNIASIFVFVKTIGFSDSVAWCMIIQCQNGWFMGRDKCAVVRHCKWTSWWGWRRHSFRQTSLPSTIALSTGRSISPIRSLKPAHLPINRTINQSINQTNPISTWLSLHALLSPIRHMNYAIHHKYVFMP